jgi:predicted CoA-binding protein
MKLRISTRETIDQFLAHKRLAMVGLSRNPKDFSAALYRELTKRGYEVVPVNPLATEVQGQRCFAHVSEIEPRVEAALLMTSPDVTDSVLEDCAQVGVAWLWMYGVGKHGAATENAVQFCRQHGIHFVAGECPFMFLPGNGFHRVHGWVDKILGTYPQRTEQPKTEEPNRLAH